MPSAAGEAETTNGVADSSSSDEPSKSTAITSVKLDIQGINNTCIVPVAADAEAMNSVNDDINDEPSKSTDSASVEPIIQGINNTRIDDVTKIRTEDSDLITSNKNVETGTNPHIQSNAHVELDTQSSDSTSMLGVNRSVASPTRNPETDLMGINIDREKEDIHRENDVTGINMQIQSNGHGELASKNCDLTDMSGRNETAAVPTSNTEVPLSGTDKNTCNVDMCPIAALKILASSKIAYPSMLPPCVDTVSEPVNIIPSLKIMASRMMTYRTDGKSAATSQPSQFSQLEDHNYTSYGEKRKKSESASDEIMNIPPLECRMGTCHGLFLEVLK